MIPKTVIETLEKIEYLIIDQELEVESIDPQTTILKGEIRFIDGSQFHFMEYIGQQTHDYRFHYMDDDENLIRRWDNAPHHQELKNFPFHVHTSEEVKSSKEFTFPEIVEKVENLIIERIEE